MNGAPHMERIGNAELWLGDCREVLPTLPSASVHCVVCSPPYWRLRDYGTARWEGGDATCRHTFPRQDARLMVGSNGTLGKNCTSWTHRDATPPRQCACGARRVDSQIGLEADPEEYIATLVGVFREVRRVLRADGTLWLNMGDAYATTGYRAHGTGKRGAADNGWWEPAVWGADRRGQGAMKTSGNGYKPKDLLMMPARLALALQADGWWLRSDIIWMKPNPMPESVTDRPTSAHEHVFLLTRSPRYFFDAEAVREAHSEGTHAWVPHAEAPSTDKYMLVGHGHSGKRAAPNPAGRNIRNVWEIATSPFSEWTPAHALVPVPASEAQERAALKNAGGHDTARITSPDCPLHAGQTDWVPTGFYDGLSADQLSHIRDNSHRVRDTNPGSSTTQHIPVRSNSLLSMRGCSDLEDAAFAMPHNSESRRTDHGPLFSEHAMSCAETDDGRPHIAPLPLPLASIDRSTAENRTEDDNSGGCAPEMAAGNVHRSACRCGYYRKMTTKTSHFATFPPALVERCIRAGTSERGCCAGCGAPWARATEARFVPQEDVSAERGVRCAGGQKPMDASSGWSGVARGTTERKTTGWRPSCACGDARAPVPATVLDPFAGAGTTLLVADRLQRRAVGIELNGDYTRMAMARVVDDAPLFTAWPPAEDAADARMADLFEARVAEAAE